MKKPAPDITQFHQEQLTYIGQLLREMREEVQLSHDDLARKTLIRASLLRAIEAGDISQLPEPVYTRGLIHRYGESLGLDGEALASQYFTPPNPKQSRSFWRVPLTAQLRPLHLYATYIVIIGVAISALSYTLERTTARTTTLPVLEGEVAEDATMPEPSQDTGQAEGGQGQTTIPASVSSEPVQIAVEMQGQSWIRVTADDKVVFEGILQEGDTNTWTAQEKLTIRAGNAGGVMVAFNGKAAEVLGQPGAVKETTFSPEEAGTSEETASLNASP